MVNLTLLLKKNLKCSLREANYITDIVKSYHLKESDNYYSLLPELLQIIEGGFNHEDKINDLSIILSLYFKNNPDYLYEDLTDEFIRNIIDNEMVEFKNRLSDSELNQIIDKVASIILKL